MLNIVVLPCVYIFFFRISGMLQFAAQFISIRTYLNKMFVAIDW